jgi:formate/nitrite transporter
LFTGNNLIAMAWASGLIGSAQVLRNWGIVYLGNVVGCLGTVLLVWSSDLDSLAGGALAQTAIHVAETKVALSPLAAFSRGVLCNALVCLAVWLAMGGRSAADKILAIIFPITAFVAIGLEHSIANWFLLPLALVWDANLTPAQLLGNLFWVTLGNILGGTLLVAGVYWLAYLRPERRTNPDS